ncbi:serine protease inhibitor 2.1-like [Thunnus albacares]|uniref:serine protease inhibitor 2.1-like n=1 Tax=Thunnus albacares TaxID=8236 RepID=UPI001CF6C428|nr:serine protease inhibitor 2.1-like [Thunnus albacares]
MKKFTMMRAALGIWILSAVVCVGRGHHHEGHDQDTALDSSADSVSLVTSANKEFAYRMYKKLAAHTESQGKNIFFSPASLSIALAALSVGARGETHRQLFSSLGFNSSLLTQTDVDQYFRTLLQRANKTSQEDISEGTAVFVDNRFKPQPEFLDVLKQSYFADGFEVDFTKSTDSANTINKYVEEKTNGKIDKLVESLDPSTVMYLVSYIFYKGKWATPFDPKLTKKGMFTVDESTKVPVQMMNMEQEFDTYYDQAINTLVLHLPFNNSYSMLLLLPDDMATLENDICPSHVTKWLKGKVSRTYDVYIPKFSIKTSYSLKDMLIEMGMTDMFSDRADLSGISEGRELHVSEVVHKAALDVDEAGATAAAATGMVIIETALIIYPVLKFNRPFMVLITEDTTENILFMGKIINPNI